MRPFADLRLERIALYFEALSAGTLQQLSDLYHPRACFKDPFNEVQGVAAIKKIFSHMYTQVKDPRFKIVSGLAQAELAWLEWDFLFEKNDSTWTIRGASKLVLDSEGKIIYHRDYWDTGEELYAKLPIISWLIRLLQKKLSAHR
jgi:steroid delta-isomerase